MFDIHCHILPGVDDGSSSLEESVAMLKAAKAAGIDCIVCTPHVRWSDFDAQRVEAAYQQLRPYAEELRLTLDLGYEVNWKKLSELGIERAPEFTLGDTNMFLLELDDAGMPPNWQRFIYQLQGMGLQVIIAHPERCRAIQKNLVVANDLKNTGCFLQLSANFVEGGLLDARKRTAAALLREDLVDYLASDAHCPEDYATYTKALAYCRK